MRVLLLHNHYRSANPSGENIVVELEEELLKKNGHDVSRFTRHSDSLIAGGALNYLSNVAQIPWNRRSAASARTFAEKFRPDVTHVHNTFPILSPAVFHSLSGMGRVVLTLHNYRIFCPAAIPMRQGEVCVECLSRRSVTPALRHGCYRDSRLRTAPIAASVALHRAIGTWEKKVDAFIVFTEFQKDLMAKSGLPESKIHIKPNFFPGSPPVVAWNDRKPYVVFAGRLSAEKGVRSLVTAWRLWGPSAPELRVIGDGDLRRELETLSAGLPVTFYGQLSPEETQAHIAFAQLQVLPSEWFEGFPMVVREAFAFGTPVAVSNIGALPTIVAHRTNGIVFEAKNPVSLVKQIKTLWEEVGSLEQLGKEARNEFERKYTEKVNYETLMRIYQQP